MDNWNCTLRQMCTNKMCISSSLTFAKVRGKGQLKTPAVKNDCKLLELKGFQALMQ